MSNLPNTQSQKRFSESVASLFKEGSTPDVVFLKSSSDWGVMRNGGRNGARFAPQSFLTFFKRLTLTESMRKMVFLDQEVSSQNLEKEDFNQAQILETKAIEALFKQHNLSTFIHIGGGHDHIFPLLSSLHSKKIIVVNIDAHADTRVDDEAHSGNPFRRFAKNHPQFELYQIGLHPFANSLSTLQQLEQGTMKILWRSEFSENSLKHFFEQIKSQITEDTKVIFSLDADALDGSIIPGVSAVNGAGLGLKDLKLIWNEYKKITTHAPIIGIYELNPIYDTLSGLSMRTMAGFVFEIIQK